jgi:hypothetical protein
MIFMKSRISFLLIALVSSCGPLSDSQSSSAERSLASDYRSSNSEELRLLPNKPTKGMLFEYYDAQGKAKWKRNWTYAIDLTGVSWNDSRTATLIAPQFVVMAAHYIRPSDVPVTFHDRRGNPQVRYITQVKSLTPLADIAIGKLNLPVSSAIKAYRFGKLSDLPYGRKVLVTDQTKTVSIHQVHSVSNQSIAFAYCDPLDKIYHRNLIVGDSGNPTFILTNGEMRLVETHTYGGPGIGPCYADPKIQDAIRTAIAQWGK